MTESGPFSTSSNQRDEHNGGGDVQVRLGWSGEIEPNVWRKTDVELDENDLFRMLVEHEVCGCGVTEEQIVERLPTKVCFQLLQTEAEALLMKKLLTMGYPADKATGRIVHLEAENKQLLDAMKEAYQNPAA